jgi:hypothetical protein
MGTQPKREEIPQISLERGLSREQEAEINACYELLSSGRPVSQVLEEMRRIGKGGKVSNATLAIKLGEVCEQLDETPATPGSIEPSDQSDEPSTPIFEPPRAFAGASRSKVRRLVWVGIIGSTAVSLVILAAVVSVGQLPAAPAVPPPVDMAPTPEPIESAATIAAPTPEPIKTASTISATEIATLVLRGDALLGRSDVSSARLFFARAALAGDAQAAIRLAVTYDPDFIARAHLPVRSDAALAAYWYSYGGIKPKGELLSSGR